MTMQVFEVVDDMVGACFAEFVIGMNAPRYADGTRASISSGHNVVGRIPDHHGIFRCGTDIRHGFVQQERIGLTRSEVGRLHGREMVRQPSAVQQVMKAPVGAASDNSK